MKKLISQILIIAVILGTFGVVPSFAVAYDQAAVDFIKDGGYWQEDKDSFNANASATRAQVASVLANYLSNLNPSYTGIYSDVSASHKYADDIMLASNLGLVSGSNGTFRPDANITREEFSVLVVRAHEIAGAKLLDSNYLTELMKDYESISEWAKISVVKALTNGLIVSQDKKLFNPQGTVSLAELAIATHNLHINSGANKVYYTVRDVTSSDNISSDFNVRKSFSGWNIVGVSGVGMIAYFDGAPGEIYIKRNKVDTFTAHRNNFGEPVCYARITGPDGSVICYVDMDYLDSGVMEKIVNIPEGPEGIYQIQFTHNIVGNNTLDTDSFTVGVKNPSSWGIRGEDEILFVDSSLPTTGYIYIPEKFDHLSIAISGQSNTGPIKIYNESNTLLGQASSGNSSWLYSPGRVDFTSSQITAGSVIKYVLPANYYGRLAITGVTPVICSTKEHALELKGGYIYHTDKYTSSDDFFQLAGPLQKQARERMVEIYDEMGGNLAVNITIPDASVYTVIKNLDNPLAEAQPFSTYSNSIFNIKGLIDTQCVDPTNPYFGAIINIDGANWNGTIQESDYPDKDWQVGVYNYMKNQAFTGLSLNSELNPYYNNEQLVRRAELYALYLVTQLPADGMIKTQDTTGAASSEALLRNLEGFFMGDQEGGYAASYYYTRNFFSPETRRITDQAVLMIMDKHMNFEGKRPANQYLVTHLATAYTYKWSGEDRYHKNLKNQLMGMMYQSTKDSGQTSLGYWTESYGADGSNYGKMSEDIWHEIVHTYLSLPDSMKDPELVAKIYEAAELYLTWDSYFIMPSTDNFEAVHSTNWTSRKNNPLGEHKVVGENGTVINYFPRAKKNWLTLTLGTNYNDYKTVDTGRDKLKNTFSPTSNAFILTNDTWAKSYLDKRHRQYGINYLYDSYQTLNGTKPLDYAATHSEMYYVHHQDQQFDDSQMPTLPFETEGDNEFFLNENGIVGVKHKGLYMLCYFNNALPDTQMSPRSWIGGGPTNIWDDYFTTTLNGLKPGSFNANGVDTEKIVGFNDDDHFSSNSKSNVEYSSYFAENDFRHSCIVGTDENGTVFASGREKPFITMGTNSFTIKGTQTTGSRSKEIVWEYYLTDTGIQIKGGVTSYENGQNLYMQLPIYVPKAASSVIDTTNTKITISHNGNTITYDWGSETAVTRELTCSTGKYIYLKLPITSSNLTPAVTVSRSLAS